MKPLRSKLEQITQANGYAASITDIKEGDAADVLRPRGVAMCRDNGSVILRLNASGKTLDALRKHIHEVLDQDFVIEPTDEVALKVTPKGDRDATA